MRAIPPIDRTQNPSTTSCANVDGWLPISEVLSLPNIPTQNSPEPPPNSGPVCSRCLPIAHATPLPRSAPSQWTASAGASKTLLTSTSQLEYLQIPILTIQERILDPFLGRLQGHHERGIPEGPRSQDSARIGSGHRIRTPGGTARIRLPAREPYRRLRRDSRPARDRSRHISDHPENLPSLYRRSLNTGHRQDF